MTSHRYPDSAVFYRSLTRDFPLIVRAEGCWLEDEHGKRYLDGSGGAFVTSIGHGVAEIGQAMARQAARVGYVNGTAFTNEAVEGLAERLIARAPGYTHAYVLGSGSEAVEAALKLARQHWVERKRDSKHAILALTPGYHGNTLLALSAGARAHYRTYWRDWLVHVHHAPAPLAYRCPCDGGNCEVCSGETLDRTIREVGADKIAAFIVEPVGGSSTGHHVPRPEYYRNVRDICTRYDVLFVADEVLCGAGRTGTWTALEAWGVQADIMTLGKGISGGYAPVSAVLATRDVVAPVARGAGYLMHAQTFSHHPVTSAAAVAALDHMATQRLAERVPAMGACLHQALGELRDHPCVGDVRGRGLLAGVEFVADRATRTPFPRAVRFAEAFTRVAQEHGLVVWPSVGHMPDGTGDIACLAPPFIVTEGEIAEIVVRFRRALDATHASLHLPATVADTTEGSP